MASALYLCTQADTGLLIHVLQSRTPFQLFKAISFKGQLSGTCASLSAAFTFLKFFVHRLSFVFLRFPIRIFLFVGGRKTSAAEETVQGYIQKRFRGSQATLWTEDVLLNRTGASQKWDLASLEK